MELLISTSAGRTQSWFDALKPAEKKKYLLENPNSKFAKSVQKQSLQRVPKLSELWHRSDDFSDAANERARKAALKEIDSIKATNEKIKAANKGTQAARTAVTKTAQSGIDTKSVPKTLAKKIGKRYVDGYMAKWKMKGTPADLITKISKSPQMAKNMLMDISMNLGRDVVGQEKKDLVKQLGTMYKHGSREQNLEFLTNFIKGAK